MIRFTARLDNADIPDPAGIIPPELERAVREAVALLEREAKIRTPIGATEVARGSIGSEVRRGVSFGRGIRIRGLIGSPQRHVDVLERGRRPGARRPPAEALELWVRRKLGIRDIQEAKRVAFVIARSIGRKGTKAVEMFKEAAEDNLDAVTRIFDRAGLNVTLKIAEG